MAHYLIKLTPYDKFFFGMEKGFGADNKNYFVQSAYFPQQTALLGLLRYQLLCQADETVFKDNQIVDKTKVAELIGEKSFTAGEINDFKNIKSLSPVFIIRNEEHIYPLSREYQDTGENIQGKRNWQMRKILFEQKNILLQDYDPKSGLPDLLFSKKEKYEYGEIFQEMQQVGIRKNYKGETDNKAFYMQTFYSFKDRDTSFAFYAEIEGDLQSNPSILFGGERQVFSLSIEKDKSFNADKINYEKTSGVYKLVLLSDTYFDKNTDDYCDFALTDLVNFRCLKTQINTEKYYDVGEKDKVKKSEALQLYKKGSVFYAEDKKKLEELQQHLEQSEFHIIGYNYSKII